MSNLRTSRSNVAHFSRRDCLRVALAAGVNVAASAWFQALADGIALDARRRRSCILLWMSGGPSQTDTFDLKPGHENGGPFRPIQTNVPGIEISEHLPRLARHADQLALVR